MIKIEQIQMCAIHKCARECDSEIRGIGDCLCHNLNWQKANDKHMDYCLTYQMVNQKNNFICVLSSTEQGINRPPIDYNEWAIMVRKENDMLYGIAKDYKSTY